MRDQARHPHRVHVDAVDDRAAGPVQLGRRRVRDGAGRPRGPPPIIDAVRRPCPTGRRPCPRGAARRSPRTRRTGPPAPRTASSAPRRHRSSGRRARVAGVSASQPRTVSSRAASNPLVPTTAAIPWSRQKRTWSSATPGWVKSTATSAPASTSAVSVVALVDPRHQLQRRPRPPRPGRPRHPCVRARPAHPPSSWAPACPASTSPTIHTPAASRPVNSSMRMLQPTAASAARVDGQARAWSDSRARSAR